MQAEEDDPGLHHYVQLRVPDALLHPVDAFQRGQDIELPLVLVIHHGSASFRRCRARIALSPSMTFSHCAMFSHSMRSTWATRLMKP